MNRSSARALRLDSRVAIVGAGAVGLAVSRALIKCGFRDVMVLEAGGTHGTGTSSRNSSVLHAGIYYDLNSWKHKLCIRGHSLMLDFLERYRVDRRICGKLIVDTAVSSQKQATHDQKQWPVESTEAGRSTVEDGGVLDRLLVLFQRGVENGVRELRLVTDRADLIAMEPALRESEMARGIYSPWTGIFDCHAYMDALLGDAEEAADENQEFAMVLHCGVEGLDHQPMDGTVRFLGTGTGLLTNQGPLDNVGLVINAAGLSACRIAKRLGSPLGETPEPLYAKGSYWRAEGRKKFSHLIYPLPEAGGLGTHLTLDLDGTCRFGPNVEWLGGAAAEQRTQPERGRGPASSETDLINFDDPTLYVPSPPTEAVYTAVRRYYPDVGVLVPDYAGIRPKLRGETDFRILEQSSRLQGTPSLIHLLGIESPGLTASLAIGEEVARRALHICQSQ